MKKVYTLLFTTIFCTAIFATKQPLTPENTFFISDFDEVWINKTSGLNALAQLQFMETLFKSKKSSPQPTEQKVRKFGNLPLRLLDYGRRYPTFASYIPGLIEYVGKSRCVNQPIDNLYKHLKKEGYPIIIATNKDHMLYDLAIEALGNEIPNMVDKVFVAEPASNEDAIAQLQAFADKPTTPTNYKNMLNKALALKATEKIIHVPSKKPDKEYFKYVTEKIDPNNTLNIIYIDDKQENIDAINALQNHRYIGIVYDQNNPSQFTQELIKLGIVSEMNNKKLLDDIRYPGMWGKFKLGLKSLFESKNTQTKTAE